MGRIPTPSCSKVVDVSVRDDLPSGEVTFLFTDIEGSTSLLKRIGDEYQTVLADHHRVLREAITANGGVEVDTEGDAFLVVFTQATAALRTAVDAQRAIAGHSWPDGVDLRVRMGVHTGDAAVTTTGYVSFALHQAARIVGAAHGGQVIVSPTTAALVDDDGFELIDLGAYRVRDFDEPPHLFQLGAGDFPAVR